MWYDFFLSWEWKTFSSSNTTSNRRYPRRNRSSFFLLCHFFYFPNSWRQEILPASSTLLNPSMRWGTKIRQQRKSHIEQKYLFLNAAEDEEVVSALRFKKPTPGEWSEGKMRTNSRHDAFPRGRLCHILIQQKNREKQNFMLHTRCNCCLFVFDQAGLWCRGVNLVVISSTYVQGCSSRIQCFVGRGFCYISCTECKKRNARNVRCKKLGKSAKIRAIKRGAVWTIVQCYVLR